MNTDTMQTIEDIAGQTLIEVECLTPRAEPELCGGWSKEVELDDPAFVRDNRLFLPGFDCECPECGDSSFRVEGVEVMFNV